MTDTDAANMTEAQRQAAAEEDVDAAVKRRTDAEVREGSGEGGECREEGGEGGRGCSGVTPDGWGGDSERSGEGMTYEA